MIPKFVIETFDCKTELCEMGEEFGTDKSPYNKATMHRHSYTPIYSMLFAPYKNEPIHFAEIGIAGAASIQLWRKYFSDATCSFFDIDENGVNIVNDLDLPMVYADIMDVQSEESMLTAFKKLEKPIDILIDDSSHIFEDMIRIIKVSLPFIKPGGMIIIEDLRKYWDESMFVEQLKDVMSAFSFVYFIEPQHKLEYTSDYENNKLLVLVKH